MLKSLPHYKLSSSSSGLKRANLDCSTLYGVVSFLCMCITTFPNEKEKKGRMFQTSFHSIIMIFLTVETGKVIKQMNKRCC